MRDRIQLTGEQERVVFLPDRNPVQIKGAAGSGKTTAAIYRARHLAELQGRLFDVQSVGVFTFTKSLIAYMDYLCGETATGFTCVNFHKWAYGFLEERGEIPGGGAIREWEQKRLIKEAQLEWRQQAGSKATAQKIYEKTPAFFLEEFSWIKGKAIRDFEEYESAQRIGRGVSDRVTTKDRQAIWVLFVRYNEELQKLENYDFDDLALFVLDSIDADPSFDPPFYHVVVDEAQDLSKATLLVLTKLVSPATKSITIIADAAQQIYKSGFSWKEVGLNVLGGRSVEMKQNYRNTKQIYWLAQSLLEHESDKSDFTEALEPRRTGDVATLACFENEQEEFESVVAKVRSFRKASPSSSVCILHRTRYKTKKIAELLDEHDISFASISGKRKLAFDSTAVFLSTMSSVKGLEFDAVFITGASDGVIPRPFSEAEGDEEAHISTERRLFYTAMTRAREKLSVSCSGSPSMFVEELDKTLIKSGSVS